jgi:branched-chain amino acid transport system ATP-binding protein
MLEFRNVNTYYGDLHVLKNVNYNLGAGEIICLLGGNACGTSTTMKTIMGIVRPARHRPGAGGAAAVSAHDRV